MSDHRFTCNVDGCGKTFRSKAAKGQHRVDAHGKRSKAHYRRLAGSGPMAGMAPGDVYNFVDALDLPDGAHWAMIEELSGYEPGDFAA